MNEATVARIGRNEALFRAVNEERDKLADEAGLARVPPVCECGYAWCTESISVAPGNYWRVRSHPDWFFVRPGHEIEDVESVAAIGSGGQAPAYLVVAKRPGLPAEIAEATDPQ
jgi:hypothetical protein